MGQRVKIDSSEFALRIQELRYQHGLTQPGLALKTGGIISRNWIVRAENAEMKSIDLLRLQKLAEALDCSIDYLTRGVNYLSNRGGDLTFVVPIDVSLTREEEEMIRRMVDQLVRNLVEYFRKNR